MRVPMNFNAGSHEARSALISTHKTVNLYPALTSTGKHQIALYRTPGLTSPVTVGAGSHRCDPVNFQGNQYVVSGSELYKVDVNDSATKIGDLNTSGGRVSMVAGFNYLVLVDGSNGYTYDGTTFATITDVDFPDTTTHIAEHNGYYIAIDPDTGNFYISDNGDPTSWNALNFRNAEANPDNNRAVAVINDLIWVLGQVSTEAFYDSGDPDFPYEKVGGGYIDWGIQSPHSIAKMDNSLFFLGQNQQGGDAVIRTNGLQGMVISDDDLSYQISQLSTKSDATGHTYIQAGHAFYVLTFPAAGRTFVCDITQNNEWHERESGGLGRWRVSGINYFNGKQYAGDYDNSKLYTLDLDVYDEDGETLKWLRRTGVVHKDRLPLTVHDLIIDIEGGTANLNAPGNDPVIMLRYKRDGYWSDVIPLSIGKRGQYHYKAASGPLGDGYDWVFEISGTDAIPITIGGAWLDATAGLY